MKNKLTPQTALLLLFIFVVIIVPIIVGNPLHIGCNHIKHKATTTTILAGKHKTIFNN